MELDDFFKKTREYVKGKDAPSELAKLEELQMGLLMAFSSSISASASASAEARSDVQVTGGGEGGVESVASASASAEMSVSVDTKAVEKVAADVRKLKVWGLVSGLADMIVKDPKGSVEPVLREASTEKYHYSFKSKEGTMEGDAMQILCWAAFGEAAKKGDAAIQPALDLVVPGGKLAWIASSAIMASALGTPKAKAKSLAKFLPQLKKKLEDPKIDANAKQGLGMMAALLGASA